MTSFKSLLAAALLLAAVATAAQTTGKVHTPDVDLAYLTYGSPSSKTPVIAVNGGPGLSHIYMVQNDLWQRVAHDRQVVLYDQRGTGASKPLAPNASQSMDTQVADLEAIRAALHLDKVALVGDSYGGFLSIAYAAAHPEHVAKLILSDSPSAAMKDMVHVLPQVFPDIQEQSAAAQKKLPPAEAAQLGLRDHFRMIFYSPELMEKYLAGAPDLGFEPAVAQAVSKSSRQQDYTPKLAGFTTFPSLVLTGRYDMNVAPLTAWRMAHEIPGARIVFFEESGHLPSYEEPEKYLQVLNDFLN